MSEPDEGRDMDVAAEVARAKDGDEEALNRLTQRFWPEIQSYLARLWYPARFDPEAEASDLTQKTFIKLPRVLEGYAENGRFPAWLRRVAKYEHQTKVRSLLSQQLDTMRTVAGEAPDETLFPTGKLELRGLVQELPEGERLAWELWAQGFSHDEIAAELGIKPGSSYTRISRAKDRLVGLLMARRGDPER